MDVLVMGGTGVISRAIVERLIQRKHSVTLFNRGKRSLSFSDPVRVITGDRQDHEAFEKRMGEESFDAVIDMICFNEADAKSTVAAFGGSGAQMVFCSSSAAYRRPYKSTPIVESEEEPFDDPSFGYGFHKAQMEKYLQETFRSDRIPITIIRPSLTYGEGSANVGVLRQNYGIVDRIRKGKPLVMFGDGNGPWSFTFAPDLAKAFVGVLGNEKTYGQAYHACSEENTRWIDLYLAFGNALGTEPQIVHIPAELLCEADPDLFSHLLVEKSFAGLFDNAKIRNDVPEFRCEISLADGVKRLIEWFEQEANRVDPEKDALEDRLVVLHSEWKQQIRSVTL